LKRYYSILIIGLATLMMAFCLALPEKTQAAVGYSVLWTPILKSNTNSQTLGTIQIDISNCAGIVSGDVLTISFSSEVDLTNGLAPTAAATALTPVAAVTDAGNVEVVVPPTVGGNTNALTVKSMLAKVTRTGTTLDLIFNGSNWAAGTSATDKGFILVYFHTVKIGSIDGEVSAMVMGTANSAFPTQTLVVGKVDENGGTVATVKSVKTYGASGGVTDTIIVSETVPGSLPVGDVVKFKLPAGFAWTVAAGTWDWGWAANGTLTPAVNATDPRELQVTIPSLTTNTTKSGQFRFAGVIAVDGTIAKTGEVICHISDTASRVTATDITVMNYGVPQLLRTEAKKVNFSSTVTNIGEIILAEKTRGTFTPGTIIDLLICSGFEWDEGNTNETVGIHGYLSLNSSGNRASATILGSSTIQNVWYEISRLSSNTIQLTFLPNYIPTTSNGTLSLGDTINNMTLKIRVAGATYGTSASVMIMSPNNEKINQQELTIASYLDPQTINASLSDIKANGTSVGGFNPDVLNYNVYLPASTTAVPVITAYKQSAYATANVYQAVNLTGTAQERTATIIVRAQDTTVTKTYKVTFSVINTANLDCFIATAAYGSYLDPHVDALRHFRDNVLLHSTGGIWFVNQYYRHSPPIAAFIAGHDSLRYCTRLVLTPLVFAVIYPKTSMVVILAILTGIILITRKRDKYSKEYSL